MFIKHLFWIFSFLLMVLVFSLTIPVGLKAVTVEVEDEGEEVTPEPSPAPLDTIKKIKKDQGSQTFLSGSNQKSQTRVRISEKVGFYYFVQTGYVVHEESAIPSIGSVIGSFKEDISYSTPKKVYVEFSSPKFTVKPGDLLVVYRATDMVQEQRSGFSGFWVRNLAIVQVVEIDKGRCLVETKETFYPFEAGDKVKVYDDEISRWKQAQIKKNLPDHPIKCFVIGALPGVERFNQTDFIILTAGSKKGVVEGQGFKLRELKETGFLDPALHLEKGVAQVYYVGPDYSMAQIVSNSEPIQNGFEAFYLP